MMVSNLFSELCKVYKQIDLSSFGDLVTPSCTTKMLKIKISDQPVQTKIMGDKFELIDVVANEYEIVRIRGEFTNSCAIIFSIESSKVLVPV